MIPTCFINSIILIKISTTNLLEIFFLNDKSLFFYFLNINLFLFMNY